MQKRLGFEEISVSLVGEDFMHSCLTRLHNNNFRLSQQSLSIFITEHALHYPQVTPAKADTVCCKTLQRLREGHEGCASIILHGNSTWKTIINRVTSCQCCAVLLEEILVWGVHFSSHLQGPASLNLKTVGPLGPVSAYHCPPHHNSTYSQCWVLGEDV